jgi:hypothetical protein
LLLSYKKSSTILIFFVKKLSKVVKKLLKSLDYTFLSFMPGVILPNLIRFFHLVILYIFDNYSGTETHDIQSCF